MKIIILILAFVSLNSFAAPQVKGFQAMEADGAKYISRVTKGLNIDLGAFDDLRDIDEVNSVVNSSIEYTSDEKLYGKADHWANFKEMSSTLAGDCEDYALLKYWALRKAGVPAEDMHILVFYDQIVRIHHAVLIVNKNGEELMLDNRTHRMIKLNLMTDILPNFAINENEFFIYGKLTKSR